MTGFQPSMKILAIGNSFSQDATTFLYDIAKAAGKDIKIVNLYIGGCSLATHYNNIVMDARFYEYQLNGQFNGRMASIRETLLEEAWDYVTLQQVSGDSGVLDTYFPYITHVSDYVKSLVPGATQLLHETWAYESDSDHPDFIKYNSNQEIMQEAIIETYQSLANKLSMNIIPCGEIIKALRSHPVFDYKNGGSSLCRDGFHMDLIYGRYALAAVWYEYLLKQSILDNSFIPPVVKGDTIDIAKIKLIKDIVHRLSQS